MVSIETFSRLALAFEQTIQAAHFEKISFRVNKKIFATLDISKKKAVLKLPAIEQSVFCAYDKTIIYPVHGKWGLQGWTIVELNKVGKNMLNDALTISYCTVAPRKLAAKYQLK
jgi:hypothetical protein